jgi:uncharacterized membrane protein YhaH (DUF805 family)
MSFQEAVTTCLQRKYADFSGRARRSEFWWFYLFGILAIIVASLLNSLLHLPSGLLVWLVELALLVPALAVGARRLHDTGRSAWWLLLYLTFVGGIVLLVFYLLEGEPGPNAHGPSPKGQPAYPA